MQPLLALGSNRFVAIEDQDAELVDLWYVGDRNAVPPVYRLEQHYGRT